MKNIYDAEHAHIKAHNAIRSHEVAYVYPKMK
jgi:hypothetical protein